MATTSTTDGIEGRLLAQRKVLAMLVAELARGEAGARMTSQLHRWSEYLDHQEDPGAVPTSELAIEAAAALEVRRIAEAVERLQKREE